ncbi:uncharacterized protein ACDP82_015924 isoform 2-T3 [Pangshura tecta]
MAEESAEATSDNRLYGQLENWWSERLKIWNTLCTPSWKGYCRTREVLRWVTRRIKGLGKLSCEESLKRQRLLPWRGDGWRGDWCNAAGSGSSGRKGKRYFSLKCIKDKRIPITVTVVITALIITVIALAARKPPPCPRCPPHVTAACPDRWVGYQGKCYYFSETEGNWNNSQSHCSALNTSLASIDSVPELDFMLRYKGVPYHWIGLWREQGEGQPWKWTNGFRSEGKGSAPTWMNRGSAAPGAIQRDISSASGWMSAAGGSQAPQEGTQHLRSRKGPI